MCEILGIKNSRDAVNSLDDDEKRTVVITDFQSGGRGGDNGMRVIVNEPGLYSLILRSRKLQAKAFNRWITHEVIPAIRNTGRYELDMHCVFITHGGASRSSRPGRWPV